MYDQEKIIKKLASFLRASTEDIGKILSKQKNLKATDNENFWYFHPRSGNKPKVVLVAHIDTVKDTGQRQYVYYKMNTPVTTKRTTEPVYGNNKTIIRNRDLVSGCLGADDRAGVVAISEIYQKFENCGMLFTNFEEVGCLGASAFVKQYKDKGLENEFEDCKLFIEIDRKGTRHYVDYVTNPKEMKEWIDAFGWKEDWGTFSDIQTLSEHFLIPSINVATGYYNEHTAQEHLVIHEYFETINHVSRMVDKIDEAPMCKVVLKVYSGYKWNDDWYDSYINSSSKKKSTLLPMGTVVKVEEPLETPVYYDKGYKILLPWREESKYVKTRQKVLFQTSKYTILENCQCEGKQIFWPNDCIIKVSDAEVKLSLGMIVSIDGNFESMIDWPRVEKIDGDTDYANFEDWDDLVDDREFVIDGVDSFNFSETFYSLAGVMDANGNTLWFPGSMLINRNVHK